MKKIDPFAALLKAAGVPPKKPQQAPDDDDDQDAPAGNASVPDEDGSAAHAPGQAGDGEDGSPEAGADMDGEPDEDGDVDDDGQPDAGDPDADGDGVPDEGDADYGAGTGDVQGLYAEIAEAEKAYYAARGFHGAGHHKAEAALDSYHKIVRKMVRALTGATGEAPEQGMPGEGEEGAEGDPNDPNDPNAQQQDGDAEGDGDGVPDEGAEDDEGASDDDPGNGPPQAPQTATKPPTGMAVGKPHPGAGAPQKVAAPQQPGQGPPGAGGPPEKKKGKPFGKSEARHLRKGLYAYSDPGGEVPEKFLHDYLCGFIEEAYEEQSREREHARMARNVEYMATRVMFKIVQFIPKNANIARAAKRFAVTADVVESILRSKGIIAAPDGDGANRDSESHAAMGYYDVPRTVDPMMRSMNPGLAASVSARPWLSPDPLARGAEGVAAAPAQRRDGLSLVIDDTVDPSAALAKSQNAAQRQRWDLREAPVQVNVDHDCPLHGTRDMTKSQNLHNPYVRCSCPRS